MQFRHDLEYRSFGIFLIQKKNRHFLESFSLEGEIYYEVKFTHKIFDNII